MTTVPKQTRDRSGSAKASKALSWHLIKQARRDYDACTDPDERLKIMRAMTNALNVHAKLIETAELDAELLRIKAHLGLD
jgi:hypothetical protein